jgi:hypothetical protein
MRTRRPSTFREIGKRGDTSGLCRLEDWQQNLLRVSVMKPTFRFLFTPPPASARVFSCLNGARARCAADTGIASIVKRVVRNIMLAHIVLNILESPLHERVDLDQTELVIVLEELGVGPLRSLISP